MQNSALLQANYVEITRYSDATRALHVRIVVPTMRHGRRRQKKEHLRNECVTAKLDICKA